MTADDQPAIQRALAERVVELEGALRDLLNTYAAMIGVPVSQIVSGVGGQARAVLDRKAEVRG